MAMAAVFHYRSVFRLGACVALASLPAGFADGTGSGFLEISETSQELQSQIDAVMGAHFAMGVLKKLPGAKADLESLFRVLPKEEPTGLLSARATRYAMHRVLLSRHGWCAKSIGPEGGGFLAESPFDVFKGFAPDALADAFENALAERGGLDLGGVALMLASVEQLVEKDAEMRVTKAFAVNGSDMQMQASMTYKEFQRTIETLLRSFILGPRNAMFMTPRIADKLWTFNLVKEYPGWPESFRWAMQLVDRYLDINGTGSHLLQDASEPSIPFSQLVTVVDDISQTYGTFQAQECHGLKNMLVSLEDPECPGRVPLSSFYDSALHAGRWQFTESVEYLKVSGALDVETDPDVPTVIIPNYITSLTNCVGTFSFFMTCCMDECEPIMNKIEAALLGPIATPEQVLVAMAGISSATQPPREHIPQSLVEHLDDIAKIHDGLVPIHGRRFAQWLHSVFPRECGYPHAAGQTDPKSHVDWWSETGRSSEATRSEMMHFTDTHKLRPGKTIHDRRLGHGDEPGSQFDENAADRQCSAWTQEEELLIPPHRLILDRMREPGNLLVLSIPVVVFTAFSVLSMKARSTAATQHELFGM